MRSFAYVAPVAAGEEGAADVGILLVMQLNRRSSASAQMPLNIYYNLPKSQINLQQIQNSLAHAVVIRVPKICHTTPILKPLHWLEINERIEYTLLSLPAKLSSLLNMIICTTSWYSILICRHPVT